MPFTLSNSRGEVSANPSWLIISTALLQLFDPKRPRDRADDYILLADDPGNELQLSSKGTVRLTHAENPSREFGLQLHDTAEIENVCLLFLHAKFDELRRYPWQIEIAADSSASPDVSPPIPVPSASIPVCLRCKLPMKEGKLMAFHRGRAPVQWVASDSPTFAVAALRCTSCGHIELVAK